MSDPLQNNDATEVPSPYSSQPSEPSISPPIRTNSLRSTLNVTNDTAASESGKLKIVITYFDRNRSSPIFRFDAIILIFPSLPLIPFVPALPFDSNTPLPKTSLPNYRRKQFAGVERTYLDFERLSEHLTVAEEDCFIPALPDYGASTGNPEEEDRRVKEAMQVWCSRVTGHPRISMDEQLREFIQADFFNPPPKPTTLRKPTPGTIKKIATFGLATTGTVHDPDEQLDAFREIMEEFCDGLLCTQRVLKELSRTRKALSGVVVDAGTKFLTLSSSEGHIGLANGFRKFSKTLEAISGYLTSQANSELLTLADVLAYQFRNGRCVQDALDNRLAVLQQLEEASKLRSSKTKGIERLKASSTIRSDRVSDAIEDLEDAKKNEAHTTHRFNSITTGFRTTEVPAYTQLTCTDLTRALAEYVRAQMVAERRILEAWNSLRPDVVKMNQGGWEGVVRGKGPAPDIVAARHDNITTGTAIRREEIKDWQAASILAGAF